ncbi:MAG: hypothetical protein A3I01_14295 [Betaproteobacteria bacterium RIFCSPLOWO2_02_FULL_65_24]|nr:MAG: hypothetical protein A3I01_14295 [Betaproteobacteria bacterium RIFCSPLOWO2_02_FULL_65_24]
MLSRSQLYNAFFGPRQPEPGTIFLLQKRVYILPTRPGLAYALALAVMLIGSINYNLSLGYILTFLLASMGLVAILHTFRNLVHLHITPGRAEAVFAGETAWFELFVENRSGYERCCLSLWHQGKAAQCDVAAGRGTTVSIPAAAQKRGWLAPGRITMDTRFPLGLLRAWSYIQPDMRCLVYPKPDDGLLPLPEPSGGRGEKRVSGGGSDDFAGLRPYQASDSPRHIHWKAAARGRGLQTKVFSGRAAAELWLDWNELPANLDLEAKLARLTRWVLSADRDGLRYGLRLPALELAPDAGEPHRLNCLRALALYDL